MTVTSKSIQGRVCGYTPGQSKIEIQLPVGWHKDGPALELGDSVRIQGTEESIPSYEALLAFAKRLAFPQQGELLRLEDYRNIARNIVQPDGGVGNA